MIILMPYAALLERTAVVADDAATIEDALRAILPDVCAATGWSVGHAYVRSPDGRARSTGIWHLKDPERAAPFRAASEEAVFDPGSCVVGRMLADPRPVPHVFAVGEEPQFVRDEAAEESGLRWRSSSRSSRERKPGASSSSSRPPSGSRTTSWSRR